MITILIIITGLLGSIIRAYDDKHRHMSIYDRPLIYIKSENIFILLLHMVLLGISIILIFYKFGWLCGIGSIILFFYIIPLLFDNIINQLIYMFCEFSDNFKKAKIASRITTNKKAEKSFSKGYKFLIEKNYTTAVSFFKEAVIKDPKFVKAYSLMGFCYRELNSYQDALEACNQAIMINPDEVGAIITMGECYLQLKEFEKAAERFERAIKIEPDDYQTFLKLGFAYFNHKEDHHKDAIEAFEQCILINSEDEWAHFYLGGLYDAEGNYKKAIEEYKEAIKINPKFDRAQLMLGWCYVHCRDKKSALEVYNVLNKIDKSQADELLKQISFYEKEFKGYFL